MSDTGNETYHERVANGNSRIVVLIKNFYFGLITLKAWRSAEKDMDMIETVTDVVEVIHLHNRYFSPVWAKVGSMGNDIVMSVHHV